MNGAYNLLYIRKKSKKMCYQRSPPNLYLWFWTCPGFCNEKLEKINIICDHNSEAWEILIWSLIIVNTHASIQPN